MRCDEGKWGEVGENARAARSLRAQGRPDLVLLDIWMPDADGITLLKEWATGGQLTMPVIMMSGHGTIDTAVEATRIGAMDFLEKPIALQKLLATVKRALRAGESRATMPLSIANFGRSASITEMKKRLSRISAAGTAVLMRGEKGVMPELYARYLLPSANFLHRRVERAALVHLAGQSRGPRRRRAHARAHQPRGGNRSRRRGASGAAVRAAAGRRRSLVRPPVARGARGLRADVLRA